MRTSKISIFGFVINRFWKTWDVNIPIPNKFLKNILIYKFCKSAISVILTETIQILDYRLVTWIVMREQSREYFGKKKELAAFQ